MAEARVEVEFVGHFREVCGCRSLSLEVGEASLLDLVREVLDRFGEAFGRGLGLEDGRYDGERATVIVNGTVVEGSKLKEKTVKPGDRVVFAPSLAGGG
ncbi:MAG: MoaD/ThiS family protein [Candidatus Brockarchaeota archaeon]|nr:MoaD/ThiS family protein [Candidatus Brockarchaeota archaeon]